MSIVMNFITRRFVLLFQFFVRIFRRALCCFRRRRRSSSDAPLTAINIISDGQVVESQEWDSWEEPVGVEGNGGPVNHVEEQIRLYRQQRANLEKSNEEIEPPVDFFVEMTPQITRQTKVLLRDKAESQQHTALSLAPDPVYSSSELGVWEDNETWEAQANDDIDVSDIIREQKRQERERKMLEQQRRKEERGRQSMATRVS